MAKFAQPRCSAPEPPSFTSSFAEGFPCFLVIPLWSLCPSEAQSSLTCSSVLSAQCAGGLRSGGSRVFSSPVAGSNSSWVSLAVERSAPLRVASTRIDLERSASERSAHIRSAPERSALTRSALKRIALRRFVLLRFAFIRSASERSALERSASESFVPGRSALQRSARTRFVLERSVSESSALERSARTRFASERFAPESSGSIERFFSLHEFQGALATLMASWVTPLLGARLPLFRYCLPHRWGRLNPLCSH